MRGVCRAALWLVLLTPVVFAQNDGAVIGTVVNSYSGAAVSGMNVLLWARGGGQYQATTDDTGTFHVDGIAPGSYFIRYEREGFVPFQQVSNPIVVASGAAPVRIRIEMSPYAKLRGRVVFPDGEPAAGVEVEIPSYLSGYYVRHTASTASDGTFVFDDLTAGTFYLLATPKRSSRKSDQERVEIVPTYFPSTEERAQAERIVVRAGVESSRYEIRLRALPVYRLAGRVVDGAGKPAPRAQVSLISTVEGMSSPPGYYDQDVIVFGALRRESEAGTITGEDGSFAFASVRPRAWRLVAMYQHRGATDEKGLLEGGAASAALADHDIDDLQIRVAPMVTLEGTIEFQGGSREPAQAGFLLMTADGQGSIVAVSRRDGELRVPNLIPGPYRFLPVPAPTFAFSPASVLLGDRDVLGQVVELTAAARALRVIFNANTSSVRGTVEVPETVNKGIES